MRPFGYCKRSSKIPLVFQDTTEAWLGRPRGTDFNGISVRPVPSQVDSQPHQTAPLLLPNHTPHEIHDCLDGQDAADSSQSVLSASVVASPRFRSSRQADAVYEGLDRRLVAFHDPASALAEQYRKLYITIVRAGRVRELRTLLFSSALSGEGKTFNALNLALTIAASGGQHVLLVDTDFRKPSVHKLLGMSPKYGLVDYLLRDIPYSQLFVQTQVPGLTVVYPGQLVENPTALLSFEKIGQFFKNIKSQGQYNYIILDSSPVLLTAEPVALMQYVDSAILVVRAGGTPRDIVTQAIGILGHKNILGCVFNGIASTDSYYHNSYYTSEYNKQ
jgi:capsular exopolysaccharide synthesis family protein